VPDATVIDAGQREGIYELVRNHLGSIEDFWVALERTRDFATAERLGREFAEDFRLMEDIGWAPDDQRGAFVLTMPEEELARVLQRLHGEAVQVLIEHGAEAQASREDAEARRRLQLGYEACQEILLANLGAEPEG
jgi:hypothetical protein